MQSSRRNALLKGIAGNACQERQENKARSRRVGEGGSQDKCVWGWGSLGICISCIKRNARESENCCKQQRNWNCGGIGIGRARARVRNLIWKVFFFLCRTFLSPPLQSVYLHKFAWEYLSLKGVKSKRNQSVEKKRRCCAKLVAKLKLQVDFSFDFHSLVLSSPLCPNELMLFKRLFIT